MKLRNQDLRILAYFHQIFAFESFKVGYWSIECVHLIGLQITYTQSVLSRTYRLLLSP